MIQSRFFKDDWERNAYQSTHVWLRSNITYTENRYIKDWWTSAHDEIVKQLIVSYGWRWTEHIVDEITGATVPIQLNQWKSRDPLCKTYFWPGVLEYFVAARAVELELHVSTWPKKKKCDICKSYFWEDVLDRSLLDGIGIEKIRFCDKCLIRAIYQTSDTASSDEIKIYLLTIADFLERIPNSRDFFDSQKEILKVRPGRANEAVMFLCQNHPSVKSVKVIFGSWLNALIQTGLLADNTRPTSRGTQCIAKDGHVCLSLAEKQIDDWFHDHNISHDREPFYPNSKLRADFKVKDILIEYFGLTGDSIYDKKTKKKQAMSNANTFSLISIFPKDLIAIDGLHKKLGLLIETGQE